MTRVAALALALAASLSAAGCSVSGLGSIGPVASAPPVPPAPPPVVYGAFLEGPVGLKLTQTDRDKALAAEQDSLAAGQRKTWKGDHGVFGYVEPAATPAPADPTAPPPTGDAACLGFTSTIFINGRPQVGHGRGCPNPDGSFRVVG
jgi:surface antigen